VHCVGISIHEREKARILSSKVWYHGMILVDR
jgi:hypothetical protein